MPLHDNKPGNIEREVEQEFGDVDAGLRRRRPRARADASTTPRSRTARSSSTPRSPQWDAERGRLTLHSVTQVPYYLHLTLARCLGHGRSRIRVVKPFVGGGFGHRVEPLNFEMVTGALARAAGGTVQDSSSRARRASSRTAAGPRPTSA